MENQTTQYKPIPLCDWMLTFIIVMIPIVNIIMLFVWGFGSKTHPSKANWAKAGLIWIGIIIALLVIITVIRIFTFDIMTGRIPESSRAEAAGYRDIPTLYYFYNDIKPIRGFTADDPPKTFIAELTIGYKKGRTAVQTELIEKTDIIENTILLFLGQKKADELRTQDAEVLQKEIKNRINRIMVEKIDLFLFKELQVF